MKLSVLATLPFSQNQAETKKGIHFKCDARGDSFAVCKGKCDALAVATMRDVRSDRIETDMPSSIGKDPVATTKLKTRRFFGGGLRVGLFVKQCHSQ
jgi:hypothetical protein